MARFLSNRKLLSSLVNGVSVSIHRRGYAAVVEGSEARSSVVKAGEKMRESVKESSETKIWAPDPVSGYYRPENGAGEIDVAALREMILNKSRQH